MAPAARGGCKFSPPPGIPLAENPSADLVALGLRALGDRKRLLKAIKQLEAGTRARASSPLPRAPRGWRPGHGSAWLPMDDLFGSGDARTKRGATSCCYRVRPGS